MNVMMLAAGEGSRLRPYTLIKPKPAIPFLNIPLAAHALSTLRSIECDHLVVNTHHLPKAIHDLFSSLPHGFKKIDFSSEPVLLGSGGGIKKVESLFRSDDFILMNADEVILPKDSGFLKKAVEFHKKNKNISTLIVMKHPEAGSKFGAVWAEADHKIKAFGKEPVAGAEPWHFIGIQILSPQIFTYLPEAGESNILYDGVKNALNEGHQARIFPIECTWFETGNIQDYWAGTCTCLDILAQGTSPEKQHLIGTFDQFDSFENYSLKSNSSGVSLVHKESLIDPANIEGYVVAGKGAQSEKKLKDIVLCDNAFYQANNQDRIIF